MIKVKKSLGQHFLKDRSILKKIADFADIKKEDTVVEVGPGEGSLTEFILEKAKRVVAIEKDSRMVELLKNKFSKEIKEGKLEIIEGDILDLDWLEKYSSRLAQKFPAENFLSSAPVAPTKARSKNISPTGNYILIGNIPYYITGALFKQALESENPPRSITFVVQKEVAGRIMARDKKESILSISIKAYGKPEYGGVIKAGSFYPKPKVDSAIISIRDISKKNFKNIPEAKFFEVLKAGFAHKRKLLIKNLNGFKKEGEMREIFKECGISEKTRAENLSAEDWSLLARKLAR